MLVTQEEEKLVLDEWTANCAARGPAMERRIDQGFGKSAYTLRAQQILLLEVKRVGIQRVIGEAAEELSVPVVGSRVGVDIDLRSAGSSLLGVVHGGIDAQFLNELWNRRRQAVADRAIHGGTDWRCATNVR